MARTFRWGPFLPVRPEDSLLHVLLLLSKHRLKAVPVVDAESSKSVRGFITQVFPRFPFMNFLFQDLRLDVQTDVWILEVFQVSEIEFRHVPPL